VFPDILKEHPRINFCRTSQTPEGEGTMFLETLGNTI
jgi:hypothetical protein